MKIQYYIILMAFLLLGRVNAASNEIIIPDTTTPANVIEKKYTNNPENYSLEQFNQRTIDYPTHIVRMSALLLDSSLNCDQVLANIDEMFVKKIPHTLFFYNTIIHCGYDPENPDIARSFAINSYFDPLNNYAIDYLKDYIKESSGRDLMGASFEIEEVNGVVISLNFDAGIRKDEYGNVMLRQYHENITHYFQNNFDVNKELINDIHNRIASNKAATILPLFSKWLMSDADSLYYSVLSHADYLSLQPERIFLVDKEPKAFTSNLRMYYAHYCGQNPNKHCL